MISGTSEVWWGDGLRHHDVLAAGDCVYIPAGVPHLPGNPHPTEPAVIYAGLQDNGTAKYTGEQVWRHVLFADGGYCVVNWNDPFRVLLFANGNVFRATDGGLDYGCVDVVRRPTNICAEPPPRRRCSGRRVCRPGR